MSASAHAANRVFARMAFVHRRMGTQSSSASFTSRARTEVGKGPR